MANAILRNIPSPYRERAQFYCEKPQWQDEHLATAFMWASTYEGARFWQEVYEIIDQSDTMGEAMSVVPELPPLDIRAYTPSYIGWCKIKEAAIHENVEPVWKGIVYIHTAGPKYKSFFVTSKSKPFHYEHIYDRYWPGLIDKIEILTKL